MDIYMVRHTAVKPEGICYGHTDVELKDSFEMEAEIVKEKLKGIKHDAVFSSPLSRCTRLASHCGYAAEMQLNEQLKELHFGDWEMLPWDSLDMPEWRTDWINNPTPNGESLQQMYERLSSFLDELKGNGHKTVIIFTHGGIINCARVYFGVVENLNNAFDGSIGYGAVERFEL